MAPRKGKETLLDLCKRGTDQGNTISVRMLEYLSTSKHPPHGFRELAYDFLDICRILWAIEAGLTEVNRTHTQFPSDVILELDKKFRQTNDDFVLLSGMLSKFLDVERKHGFGSKLQKGWKMMNADTEIHKMRDSLSKSRDALRMSALMFRWSLGDAKADASVGIGYTGLAAALERMNGGKSTHVIPPLASPDSDTTAVDDTDIEALGLKMSPKLPQPPALAGLQRSLTTPASSLTAHDLGELEHIHELTHFSHPPERHPAHSITSTRSSKLMPQPSTRETYRPISRNGTDRSPPSVHEASSLSHARDHVEPHAHRDGRGRQYSTEDEAALEELIVGLDLGSKTSSGGSNVTRLKADPATVPRWTPRQSSGADSAQLKNALIAAVQQKRHNIIEQLLDRGVIPEAGPKLNLLREAVMNDDLESLRLLLLFGAEVNAADVEGFTALFAATEAGFHEGAKMLIKYGADPNLSAGPDSESPLAMSVVEDKADFVQLFLMYGGDPNHVMGNGNTVFIRAMNKKTPKRVIELMLNYGADPDGKNGEGKTPLFEAISSGRVDLVTLLLDRGANPNLPGPKHMLWPATYQPQCLKVLLQRGADYKKCSGLMELATSINNIESVKILISAGVDPNSKKDGTYTPLCSAIRDNRAELVTLLLANGADPNLMASEYPAFKCVTHHRAQYLPQLVEAGSDIHHPPGIIEMAVHHDNMEALMWLLDHGANPNDKSEDHHHTPLTTAIREDRSSMVDILLARGADPGIRGEDWPICMAVKRPEILKKMLPCVHDVRAFRGVVEMAVVANQLDSVKLLLAAGVNVEDKNGGVFSPLTTAIREDRREIVQYLLDEAGADVNSPGEHLPLIKAIRRHREGETAIIEMLLERGADVNLMYRGYNPVIQAVENGDADVLRLLVAKGNPVDLTQKDESGRTILEIVQARGWSEAVGILTGADADPER